MVQVTTKLRPFAERQAQIERQIARGNQAALGVLARAAVQASPVDTATYITSHVVYEGSSLASIPMLYSSEGREGGQARGAYEGVAVAKLEAMIEQLDHTQQNFMLGNEAEHRGDVEYLYGYAVFEAAAAARGEAVQSAKAAVAAGTGAV